MFRKRSLLALWCFLAVSSASAQEIRRGTVKSLDIEQKRIVITVDGADREFRLTEETRVLDTNAATLAQRLQGISSGTAIHFQPTADGRTLQAIKKGSPRDPQKNDDVRRGTIRKVDVERRIVTVNVEDRELDLSINDQTQIRGVEGKTVSEQLKSLAVGTPLMFQARTDNGKEILIRAMVRASGANSGQQRRLTDTAALKPLTEMVKEKYQGFEGGLYPQGLNVRPEAHEAAGLAFAKRIQPLNKDGLPDPDGQIVLLSIGMSNTMQSSQGFSRALAKADHKSPRLVFVNGAQGGMTAAIIQSEEGRGKEYWANVDRALQQALLTREQVQVVWIKQADAGPQSGFPEYAQTLQTELTRIVQLIAKRFPNCRLAYLSSRTYGGFATTNLNPEPYAYESGFAVKWLIEQQISGDPDLNYDPAKGPVRAPWLSWGPYLWANGTTPRSDGFSYDAEDFGEDGTHQSPRGQQKVGKLLLDFFQSDTTTKSWFTSTK